MTVNLTLKSVSPVSLRRAQDAFQYAVFVQYSNAQRELHAMPTIRCRISMTRIIRRHTDKEYFFLIAVAVRGTGEGRAELGEEKCVIPKVISANIVLKHNFVTNNCPQTVISSTLNVWLQVSVHSHTRTFAGIGTNSRMTASDLPRIQDSRPGDAPRVLLRSLYTRYTFCCCSCISFCRPIIIIYPV